MAGQVMAYERTETSAGFNPAKVHFLQIPSHVKYKNDKANI